MDNIRYEFLSESNLDKLRDCFNKCRKRRLPINFFKKKYSAKWSDSPLLGIIAMDENNPIALCCSTLYKFNDSLCNYLVAQLGDLVVDENYRNKGLATEMILEIEKHTVENNIDAALIFPNRNARRIFEKLDEWTIIGDFNCFKIKVDTIPILKILNKLHLNDLYFNLIRDSVSNKFVSTIKNREIVENNKIGVLVDDGYLSYKRYGKYS